jgi:hypothetical protein
VDRNLISYVFCTVVLNPDVLGFIGFSQKLKKGKSSVHFIYYCQDCLSYCSALAGDTKLIILYELNIINLRLTTNQKTNSQYQ